MIKSVPPAGFLSQTLLAVIALVGCQITGCGSSQDEPATLPTTSSANSDSIPASPVQSISQTRPQAMQQGSTVETSSSQPNPDPQELWERILERYQQVGEYSDQAEWNLQYRMDGQLFVETQTIQLRFSRNKNRWSASAFRTQLDRCDDLVFLQIQEVATNNLDQQVRVSHADDIANLFHDPIAQLYLSGATDFPLARSQQGWPALFFPQLTWLDSNLVGSRQLQPSEWTAAGTGVFRGRTCQIIQARVPAGHLEAWIDPQRDEIVRLFLPIRFLDPRLQATPTISDLRLSLDFSQQDWNATQPLPEPKFSTEHKLVRDFVKVPESFPSPWIGKPSPAIHWNLLSGRSWKLEQFAGREVAALFIPADESLAPWLQICERLKSDRQMDSVAFLLVPVTSGQLSATWQKALQETEMPVVTDGIQAWNQLGLNLQPNLVVWDGHGLVQYVGRVAPEDAIAKTMTCLKRLKQGESIALEMTADYQEFYQKYLHKLEEVSVQNLPKRFLQPTTSLAKFNLDDSQTPLSDLEQFAPQTIELNANHNRSSAVLLPQWSVSATMPQQIQWIELDGQSQLLALEGYRTIARYSATGKRLSTRELDLPDRLGIQVFLWDPDQRNLIGYQRGGKIVYRFSVTGALLQHHVFEQPVLELHRRLQEGKTTGYWLIHSDQVVTLNMEQWDIEQRWSIPGIKQFQPTSTTANQEWLGTVLTNDHLLVSLHPKGLAKTLSALDTLPGFADAQMASSDRALRLLLRRQGPRQWWVWTGQQALQPLLLGADWSQGVRLHFWEGNAVAWNTHRAVLFQGVDSKPKALDAGTSITDVAIRVGPGRQPLLTLCGESGIRTFAITETVSQNSTSGIH